MSSQRMEQEGKLHKFSLLAYAHQRAGSQDMDQKRTDQRQIEVPRDDTFQSWVKEIRQFLVSVKGKNEQDKATFSDLMNRAILGYADERNQILALIQDQLVKRRLSNGPVEHFQSLAEAIFAEVIGLNVLELILKDRQGLEEIQVIGTQIFEVRGGMPVPSVYAFRSVEEVERIQQNLVLFNQDLFNPRKRWAEVMLQDGTRVTMTGFGFTSEPTITLRFYTTRHISLKQLSLEPYETLNPPLLEALRCILAANINIVIIGSTNTGKTNLMKAMIQELPDHERIVTIESRLELMLRRDFPSKNIIEYEIQEDDPVHSSAQAFKLALRQSPKRICHAEVRDEDANLYVRACTRGHEGSMTSVHVNTVEDVPDALTDMCMLDNRGMNPDRLTKRITEYVTQIGIEMAMVGKQRKLVRLGELSYGTGGVQVHDIIRFDYHRQDWINKGAFSNKLCMRMEQFAPSSSLQLLKQLKLVRS